MAHQFCSNCGTRLVEGAAFCGTCGTPAGGRESPAAAVEPVPAAPVPRPAAAPGPFPPAAGWHSPAPVQAVAVPQQPWMKILRWVVGVVVILGGALAIFRFFAGTAAAYDCDDVAREVKSGIEGRGAGSVTITGVEEVSHEYGRGKSERRCTGTARDETGETLKLYMRGYDEGGNVMVSWSADGFQ